MTQSFGNAGTGDRERLNSLRGSDRSGPVADPPMDEPMFKEQVTEGIPRRQQEITSNIDRISKMVNNADYGCVDSVLSREAIEKGKSDVNSISEAWESALKQFAQYVSPGNPFWFADAAAVWIDVRETLTGHQYVFDENSTKLPALQSWESDDAETYLAMPHFQRAAIDKISEHCKTLSDHAHKHMTDILDQWQDVADFYLDYAQTVASIVARFATLDPMKWLDLVSNIVGAVSELIDHVQEGMGKVYETWKKIDASMYELKLAFSDNSAMIDGQWPTMGNI